MKVVSSCIIPKKKTPSLLWVQSFFAFVNVRPSIFSVLRFTKEKVHMPMQVSMEYLVIFLVIVPSYGMGYHLYRNNWYTSSTLCKTLLAENTNLTGTIHPCCKSFLAGGPSKLFKAKRKINKFNISSTKRSVLYLPANLT